MNDFCIPSVLQPLIARHDIEPVTIGCTQAHVFRLKRDKLAGLFLKCGKAGTGIKDEADRLQWLQGRVRVPSVIAFVTEHNWEFLLTEALQGRDGTEIGRDHPEAVVAGLARELRMWHLQPIDACPFDAYLAVQVARAKANTENGSVNEDDFDEERRGRSALELLEQLQRDCPETEERVLTHGDACVPNAIFDGAVCTGFVDCGRAGIGDPYRDIALAARSIEYNFGAQWVPLFFEHYGLVNVDEAKLAFYRLLDEFF